MNSAHTGIFQTSDFIAYTTIALTAVLEYVVPSSFKIERTVLYALGVIIVVASWLILILAKKQFRKFQQESSPGHSTTQIVTSGIFSYSRNPMYLGVVLLVIGVGIFFDSVWIAGSALAVGLLIQFFLILPEEKYLQSLFGETYSMYRKNTRRWI